MFYPKSPFLRNKLVESQLIEGNTAILTELLPWLCQTPTVTTYRVNLLKTTTVAFSARLEQLLSQKFPNPPKVFLLPQLPEVVCIDSFQTPTSQPDSTCKEVIVDSCCGAALLRGAHLYAPGVLAMETGTKTDDQIAVYADLAGKCKRGTNIRYESPEKLFVGIGVARMQRYQLYTAAQTPVQGVAVEMTANIAGVPALGDLSGSEALLQNLPSIVCVRVLDAQPGERVLDMCASPGNKTTHIAEMMRDEGVLVALDKTAKKIVYIEEKIKRNDLKCIKAFPFDSTRACVDDAAQPLSRSSSGFVPPFAPHSFDRILLDAPCSALGNRPMLASAMTPKMLRSFPNVQRKLFAAAVPLLRTHGVLVYSTCTVTAAENESMVAWALQKFPQLQLTAATPILGGFGLPNLGLDDDQRKLVQRFGLAVDERQLDTVGFFIAKFIKRQC